VCSLSYVWSSGVLAGAWEFNPQITVQEVFSDNIELAPSGAEDSDFVTELTPTLNVEGRDTRYTLDLNYALQGLIYAGDSDRNNLNHLLGGATTVELIRDHGFLDATANYGPRNISSTGVIGVDNISVTDQVNIFDYAITPRWTQPFRNYAVANLSYTHDQVLSSSDELADTTGDTIRANVHSSNHFTTWLWSVEHFEQYIDTEGDPTTIRFRNSRGRLDYLFTPHWGVIGQLGYDDNDFDAADEPNGILWGVGMRWMPSRRTSMEVIGGERFFGRTFSASAVHTGRRFRLRGAYTEEPTVTRYSLLDSVIFPTLDPFGQPIVSPIVTPGDLSLTTPNQVSEVLVTKALTLAAEYIGNYHDFEVGVGHDDRDYQFTGDTEEVMSVDGTWTWRFTPRTRSALRLRYVDEEFRDASESQYYLVDFVLTRNIGRTLEASLGARHLTRDGEGAVDEYDENRVFLLLVKYFE
jgi:uncharacterized protein (PEP-CTERM system associated)